MTPAAAAVLFALLLACTPRQQFAALGDFALEDGEILRDCRIGYRTFGELDAARSNAVLVTPWAMGTSWHLARQIASGKLLDPSRRYVIAVDAFGNGVASSPSNSERQRGDAFPRFSMRDVVESQYQLLTRVLGVRHLEAVVGTSAGGMQAFQWTIAHPEFVDRAIAIAGSPRSSPADRRRWDAAVRQPSGDARDFEWQARAIVTLDVSAPFGGSMQRAAAAVRAKLLVIVPAQDEVVDPAPALEFARLARAEVLVLDGRCGHRAPICEGEAVRSAIARFLEDTPR
jgi:homoserine O-acetyltransferase